LACKLLLGWPLFHSLATRRGQTRALVVGYLLACGTVRVATAEPSPDARRTARQLADEGANAYAERDYARALGLFERAHELVPAPTIALFQARTLAQLGRLSDARAAYLRLADTELPADAPAPFRTAVENARTELALLERRIPRLRIVLTGDTRDDAVVFLDERPLAAPVLRGWVLVDPGPHSLRLRTARGFGKPTRVTLAEGQAEQVRLESSPPARDPRRTWGYVAIGVGGAGLSLGVSAGLVALDAHDDAERGCPGNRCVPGTSGADAVGRFRAWRTVSTVGYVLGGVGLGAGLALVLTSNRDRNTQVAIVPTWGGARVETAW
jgi:hypothetical protein